MKKNGKRKVNSRHKSNPNSKEKAPGRSADGSHPQAESRRRIGGVRDGKCDLEVSTSDQTENAVTDMRKISVAARLRTDSKTQATIRAIRWWTKLRI